MKKILLVLVLALLIFVGCNAKNNFSNDKEIEEIVVDGEKIKLSYENNFLKMTYKESLTAFTSNTVGKQRIISYNKNNENILTIHLVYFENKNIDEVMSDNKYLVNTKLINDLEYQYYEYEVNEQKGHTYVYYYDGTTYTINFLSNKDITQLETAFMKNVQFKG